MKKGLKDIVAPQGMFEDLGLKYIGPVDGHDIEAVEHALRRARGFIGPVLVHCITHKGQGYQPALDDAADNFHGIGVIDPDTGLPLSEASVEWGEVFGDELVAIGEERPDIVAITAAMLLPTRLGQFAERFPDRVFDVGIAEQHAATSAAGLAIGGLHPVFAVYATFLNRAFDQVLMDVALHRCGVTFALTHAGVTGNDGPSHNGMWDLAVLQVVPGLRIAAPRDGATLRSELREAVAVEDAPTVVRFPKGAVCADIPAVATVDGVDVLRPGRRPRRAARLGRRDGRDLPRGRAALRPAGHRGHGGRPALGQAAAAGARRPRARLPVPGDCRGRHPGRRRRLDGRPGAARRQGRDAAARLRHPGRFLDHAKRAEVLAEIGLTAQDISREIVEAVAQLDGALDQPGESERPTAPDLSCRTGATFAPRRATFVPDERTFVPRHAGRVGPKAVAAAVPVGDGGQR